MYGVKMKKENNFKKDFLWGASSSAYQFEGAWNEDGKGLSVQDVEKNSNDNSSIDWSKISDFKIASDHYHFYKEDVKLMAQMGLKAYRFSISWSRILPKGIGAVNQKGINFYHNLIDELLKYNIEPIVTMFHFDLPLELENKGGWNNRDLIVDAFVDFAKILFKEYGNKVKYWITINEQNMIAMVGDVIGIKQENVTNKWKVIANQNHNMLIAQSIVFELLHKMFPNSKIGPAPNVSICYPKTSSPEDLLASKKAQAILHWWYLDVAVKGKYNKEVLNFLKEMNAIPEFRKNDIKVFKAGKPNFIAFNYYSSHTVQKYKENNENKKIDQHNMFDIPNMFSFVKNEYLGKTQFGWTIDPVGFRLTFKELYERYNLPLLVSENGLGTHDTLTKDFKIHDDYRIEYLKQHIQQMKYAVSDGVEIIGYCPWSVIDLVSTHEGVSKRYGFIYVNRDEFDLKDMKRYCKDSFYWYQKVIKQNGNC